MKMKLLFAVMASFVALSAQAKFEKCDSDECNIKRFTVSRIINGNINRDLSETLPNGKKVSYSILKDTKLDALKNSETGELLVYSPKGSCQQLYLLGKIYQLDKKLKNLSDADGMTFFTDKILKKCPNFAKSGQ